MPSWMKTGFGAANQERDNQPTRGPRDFFILPEETQRILFLDDEPSVFWEHHYKWNGKYGNFTPCLERNGIAESCPLCENVKDSFAYLAGFHSVITLTPVTLQGKKGKPPITFCFQRKVFRAKMGSKDKPGTLKKLERIKSKEGGLRGLVIECYRSGKKTESVGDELTVVDRWDPDTLETKAVELVGPFVEKRNKTLSGDKKIDINKWLSEFNPWAPFDFEELIKPMEYKAMLAKFPPRANSGDDDYDGGSRGSSGSDDVEDDDEDNIPY